MERGGGYALPKTPPPQEYWPSGGLGLEGAGRRPAWPHLFLAEVTWLLAAHKEPSLPRVTGFHRGEVLLLLQNAGCSHGATLHGRRAAATSQRHKATGPAGHCSSSPAGPPARESPLAAYSSVWWRFLLPSNTFLWTPCPGPEVNEGTPVGTHLQWKHRIDLDS